MTDPLHRATPDPAASSTPIDDALDQLSGQLSEAGQRRRAAILRSAHAVLGDRVRQRQSRRGLGAVALLGAATVALVFLLPTHRAPRSGSEAAPAVVVEPHRGADPTPTFAASSPTLASLPSRVSIAFDLIDDDDLVEELAALGIAVRVVHVGERDVQLIRADGSPLRSLARASDSAPLLTPSS